MFMLLSESASAQAGSVEDEIFVTAQKRVQTISEVPISLATLDSDFIEDTGIESINDAAGFVPNFNFYQGYDRSEVAINVRGLNSGTANPGIDPSVGVFVDGVYISRPATLTGKMPDIVRMEVLRGPQGTLYGRNTSAGAVNVYTQDPTPEFESALAVGYGNYNALDVQARISGPLSGRGGFVLSGFYAEADSYLEDAATGNPIGKSEDFGFRGKLVFDPSENLNIKLAADYSENSADYSNVVGAFRKGEEAAVRGAFDRTVMGAAQAVVQQEVMRRVMANPAIDPMMLAGQLRGTLGAGVAGALFGNIRFLPNVEVDTFDRLTRRSDEPESDDLEQYGVSAEVNLETSLGTLTSITAYRESEDFAQIDPDLTADDIFMTSVLNEDDQFTQELRLASDSDEGRFNYLLGLYYIDSGFTADTQTAFGVPLFARFNMTMPPNPITQPQRANSVVTQDLEAFAVFGQLSFDVSERLGLTYGFRYNDEEKSAIVNQNPDPGVNSTSGIPFPLQFPVFSDDVEGNEGNLEGNVDDTDYINMVSLNYEFDTVSNIYATYAEGLKSGGINASTLLNKEGLTFEKETSRNFEVGYRGRVGNLRFNTAAFYTTFDNLQVQTFDPTNPANIIVTNAGEAEIYGLEGDILWMLTDNFTINASAAYNHSEYKDTQFPRSAPVENPTVPVRGVPGLPMGTRATLSGVTLNLPRTIDVSGETLSRAPEFSAALGAQYDFALGDNFDASLRADFLHTGSQFLDAILSPESEISSYSLVNLKASVSTRDGKWRLAVFGDNVFDEDYYTQVIASPGAAGLALNREIATWFGVQGAPTTYGVSVSKRF